MTDTPPPAPQPSAPPSAQSPATPPQAGQSRVVPRPASPTQSPGRTGLWRSLTHDWAAKLLALLAACVLWYFASEDRRTIIQQTFDVPVTVRDNTGEAAGEKRAVSGLSPGTVKVTLSGRPPRLRELRGEQIEAVTDITNLAEGSFNTAVTVTAPDGTEVVQVTPERVQGLVDTVQTLSLPVTVTAFAAGAEGAARYEVQPAKVTVSGPSRSVSEVAQVIYAPISLEAGQSRAVHLLPLDSEGQPVPDITLNPPSVTLTRLAPVSTPEISEPAASAAAAQ